MGAAILIANPVWRFILILPCGVLLTRGLFRWLTCRHMLSTLEQFRRLLEHLLARLTAGSTLESALSEAPACLAPLLNKRSPLFSALLQLDLQLSARQPLERLLPALEKSLPCPDAAQLLRILTPLRHAGGNVVEYIRQCLHLVVEKINLLQDIAAETTQRRTEAVILTLMPFAMAFMLRHTAGFDPQQYAGLPAYQIGMSVCYGLAMLAATMTISMISRQGEIPAPQTQRLLVQPRQCSRFLLPGRFLAGVYRDYLPETYGLRLVHLLCKPAGPWDDSAADSQKPVHPGEDKRSFPGQPERLEMLLAAPIQTEFFRQKSLLILVGLFIGSILSVCFPGQWFWLLIFSLGGSILQDQQIFRQSRSRQQAYRLEYPFCRK
jgi:Flp pilus assembly protein TadB